MSRMYTAIFENVTLATASGDIDLFEILPATNKPCSIVGILLGQSTELGDAAEEQLRVSIIRLPATPTSGSGGATPSIFSMDPSTNSAGFVVETNNTTIATTSGTLQRLLSTTFNLRAGLELWFPPECRPQFANLTLGIVRLEAAVVDDLSMSGTIIIEEY